MIKWLVFFFTGALLLSCNNTPGGGQAKEAAGLQVTGPCAVFYTPDENRLQALQREFGEKNFKGVADANLSYMNEARQFLTAHQVKIIPTSQAQLNFVKRNGQALSLNLNRSKFAWEIFLFNGEDDPVRIDMTNIEEEFRNARMNVQQSNDAPDSTAGR
jgi:hypothetical protein